MNHFDVLDKMTLPSSTVASKVSGRVGFDIASATCGLAILIKSAYMKLLRRPMFARVRRNLLHNFCRGQAREFAIDIKDKDNVDKDTKSRLHKRRIEVLDSQGQTYLIFSGAAIQLQCELGLDYISATAVGIHYPEKAVNIDTALELQIENGGLIEGLSLSSQLCFANRGGVI